MQQIKGITLLKINIKKQEYFLCKLCKVYKYSNNCNLWRNICIGLVVGKC